MSVSDNVFSPAGWVGLFHLPVTLGEVIEPFKAIPLKVWACNFCSLSKNRSPSVSSFNSSFFQPQMIPPVMNADSQ